MEPQDIYHDWDILSDEGYKWAQAQVEEADWTHAAFPCKSFTRARRSDVHRNICGGPRRCTPGRLGTSTGRGGQRDFEEDCSAWLQGAREGQVLHHGESTWLVCLGDQDSAATHESHECKVAGARPMPLRGGDQETHWDLLSRTMDGTSDPEMRRCAPPSSSRRWTHWPRVGSHFGRLDLANFKSCGITGRPLLGMGRGTQDVARGCGWAAMAGIEDAGENRRSSHDPALSRQALGAGRSDSCGTSCSRVKFGDRRTKAGEREC